MSRIPVPFPLQSTYLFRMHYDDHFLEQMERNFISISNDLLMCFVLLIEHLGFTEMKYSSFFSFNGLRSLRLFCGLIIKGRS